MSKTLTFYLKFIFFFFFISGFVQSGQSQSYPNFKKYTTENGLPSSHVYTVIKDQKGFIWIATDSGVAKYDGYSFKYFTAKDGLPSDDVFKLSEDNKGRIWLSTFNEIGYIFNDKYYAVNPPEGVTTNGILIHHVSKNGNSEGHFIEIMKSKRWLKVVDESVSVINMASNMKRYDEYSAKNIIPLGQDSNGENWFGHFSFGTTCLVISKLDTDDNFSFVQEFDTRNSNFITKIKVLNFPESTKSLIVSGDDFYTFDFEKIEALNLNIPSKNPVKVFKINEKEIIITEDESYLLNIDSNKLKEIKLSSNKNLSSMTEDNNKNLWASSFNGIFFQSNSSRELTRVAINDDINKASITAVFEDKKGRIWFGTKDQKLFYRDNRGNYNEVVVNISGSDFPKEIFSISDNPKEGIVVSGNFGITNITEDDIESGVAKRKMLRKVTPLLSAGNTKEVLSIVIKSTFSQDNNVYIGSSRGFLSFSDTNPLSVLKNGRITNEDRVYVITAFNKVPYLGKKSGLYRIENQQEEFLDFSQPISVLTPDNNSNLWIGTEGDGLSVMRNDSIYHFPETKGKTIKAIDIGDNDDVWILTDTDILKVKITEKEEFKYVLRYSTIAEGLQIKSINKFLISNQRIYLCTNMGLQVLDTNLFKWEDKGREVFFTKLEINGKAVEIKDNYELDYTKNCLKISYVSLEFNKPDEVNYEYKLEGLDTIWRSSNSLKQEFWFLQPGIYTFNLRAGLNSQNISKTKELTFHIKAPWWKTPLAWAFFISTFILLVVGVVSERSKRIIRKAKEKAKIEEQISDMRLQALQSQMNPHFIFNSLQAIQDYIFDKNEEQANKYLVKFSRLMRLILESSRKKFILLSEELRLIELYVSLEQLRFSEQFSYQLSLSDNINQETLLVPSMLIQPFIENAVNHGLFHKKDGHGLLEVSIEKIGNYLIIVVADNGIGLKAAQAIKEKMQRKEASRALEIVRERTSLYNKTMQEDIDLKIENRLDSSGEVIGTLVTLKLILPKNKI